MAADIDVHVKLPRTVTFDSDWEWLHLLRCPVSKLADITLSAPPYMWLRFATYTILGAHGRLSTSPDALHEPDYDDLVLPLQSRTFYYHFENDSEQARLFVLDPELMNPRSSITQSTNRTSDFKQGVLARDARRCIVTGAARTQAAHLIAHGDQVSWLQNLVMND